MSGYMEAKKRSAPSHAKPLRLDPGTQAQVRRGFGIDPGELELGESPEVRAMGARAVAQGNVIRFAPGEFSPGTAEGRAVLGHELAHVRSQALGEVPMTGGLLREPGCEAAADRAGDAFAAGSLGASGPVDAGALAGQNAPAQGLFGLGKKIKQKYRNAKASYRFGKSRRDIERFIHTQNSQTSASIQQARAGVNPGDEMGQRIAELSARSETNERLGPQYAELEGRSQEAVFDLPSERHADNFWARLGRRAMRRSTQGRRMREREQFMNTSMMTGPEEEELARLKKQRVDAKESIDYSGYKRDDKANLATMFYQQKPSEMEGGRMMAGLFRYGEDDYNYKLGELARAKTEGDGAANPASKWGDVAEILTPHMEEILDFDQNAIDFDNVEQVGRWFPDVSELSARAMSVSDMLNKYGKGEILAQMGLGATPEEAKQKFTEKAMELAITTQKMKGILNRQAGNFD